MEPVEDDDIIAKQSKEMEAKFKDGPKKKPMLLKNRQEVFSLSISRLP